MLIAFYSDVTLHPYLELLKTTIFYHFLLPFINKLVSPHSIIGTKSGVVKIISTFDKDQPKHLKAQLQKSVQRVDLQDVVVSQTSAFVVLTHCGSYSVFRLHSAQTNLFRCLFQC